MAHADYNCCAICDSKLAYAGYSANCKEEICPYCVARMAETGKICVVPEEVVQILKNMNDDEALNWLHTIGFSPCYYNNEIDQYIIERGLMETGSEGGKWGKGLKKL